MRTKRHDNFGDADFNKLPEPVKQRLKEMARRVNAHYDCADAKWATAYARMIGYCRALYDLELIPADASVIYAVDFICRKFEKEAQNDV